MARKVVSRKALREEAEAAEAAEKAGGAKKKKVKKKAAKRKSRAKAAEDQRKRVYWGVYSQSLKLVAKYEFNQKKHADKKAVELSKGGKSPHFVKKDKVVIEDSVE